MTIKTVIDRMKTKAKARLADMDAKATTLGAQGEIIFERVDAIPDGFSLTQPDGKVHIVAHSETGHHHVIDAEDVERFTSKEDAMTAFLRITGTEPAEIKHLRASDTHPSVFLEPGIWKGRIAREEDLLGEVRRVAD